MSQFAKDTSVSSDRSRAEIEKTLRKYGADQFMSGWDNEKAVLGFRLGGRQVKFILPMPNPADFTKTPTGKDRTNESALKAHEQAIRQKWRAMALVIKAKLEAVESGITEFDDEFMAHIVLPDGSTAGQFMRPQIKRAYEQGDMPALLPDYSGGR